MQIYSGTGFKLGFRNKSYSAEFSPNPDNRLKKEITYPEYIKRIKYLENNKMRYRININKARNERNLGTFKEQDFFDEIIEESELEEEQLTYFLVTYNLNIDINYNIEKFIPLKIVKPLQFVDINDFPAITKKEFIDTINIDEPTYININKNIQEIEGLENLYNIDIVIGRGIEYVTYQRIIIISIFFSSYLGTVVENKLKDIINLCDKDVKKYGPLRKDFISQNNFQNRNSLSEKLEKIVFNFKYPNYKQAFDQVEELKKINEKR